MPGVYIPVVGDEVPFPANRAIVSQSDYVATFKETDDAVRIGNRSRSCATDVAAVFGRRRILHCVLPCLSAIGQRVGRDVALIFVVTFNGCDVNKISPDDR